MKKLNKKSFLMAVVALLLGGGAYLNYLQATHAQVRSSDLTLANLEAMAFVDLNDPDFGDGAGCRAANKCGYVEIECNGMFSCESGQNGTTKYVMCDGLSYSSCTF